MPLSANLSATLVQVLLFDDVPSPMRIKLKTLERRMLVKITTVDRGYSARCELTDFGRKVAIDILKRNIAVSVPELLSF